MLTRLQVQGFKNLSGLDVRFGPFTCIAGENNAGKSNLFDAIGFLSALAEKSFLDAAFAVRGEGDFRGLFNQTGGRQGDRMSLVAEMLIPSEGADELGQKARATTTLVRYELELRLEENHLALVREDLVPLPRGEAYGHLMFPHTVAWRSSVVTGSGRRGADFISTAGPQIRVHQEGRQGRSRTLVASSLPRTVLSSLNAVENPTAALVQREMRSWRVFQFDPQAMRRPDAVATTARLGPDGSQFAASLYRLLHSSRAEDDLRRLLATRLSEFLPEVDDVWVDRDDSRGLLTAMIRRPGGASLPLRALSDGALRFLALTVLSLDPHPAGLLCLEEPATGIHPIKTPALLDLLRSLAADVTRLAGRGNPLRQVMIISQLPTFISEIDADDLLVASASEQGLTLHALPQSWRAGKAAATVAARDLLAGYLDPLRLGLRIPVVDSVPRSPAPEQAQLPLPLLAEEHDRV